MPAVTSTSGRIHSEFVRLLFLQAHRETDRFFAASVVQLAEPTSGIFHFRRAAFSSQLKSKVGNILAKAAALRINLNIDGAPVTSKSHTISLANLSYINLVSNFRCSSPPRNPVYVSHIILDGPKQIQDFTAALNNSSVSNRHRVPLSEARTTRAMNID